LVAVVALALGACSTGASAPTTSSSVAATTSTTFVGSTAPVSVLSRSPAAHLRAVRVEKARVTFEFEDAPPGYRVAYTERPVTQDGSGAEVQVAGDSVLSVRMESATGARANGSNVVRTYTGPDRVGGPAGGVVVEAVATGDFEAVLNWAIGVRGHPAFRVTMAEAPARIVVELAPG